MNMLNGDSAPVSIPRGSAITRRLFTLFISAQVFIRISGEDWRARTCPEKIKRLHESTIAWHGGNTPTRTTTTHHHYRRQTCV